MRHTMLTEPAELQWLRETALKTCKRLPPFAVAELFGNEDAPERVVLYEVDHVNSLTMELRADANGDFYCESERY